MLLSRFRKSIDANLPVIGQSYRFLREFGVSRSRQTSYGFSLSGAIGMSSGKYEEEESAVFLEFLEHHDTVLDIGANIGFYSCLASSRGKHVLAFEPSTRNLNFLYRNLWNNGFVDTEVFPVGLGEKPGLKPIFGFGGISSFVHGWAQTNSAHYSVVPVSTLDSIVGSRFQGARLLIKMDVEGFELDVLRGASGVLQATPRPSWLVEIMLQNSLIPGGINSRFCETFEMFWKHGYRCMRLDGSRLPVSRDDVSRWAENRLVESGSEDFLFYCAS